MTQARAELSDLVNRVAYGGERVVLSRHGRAVAAIVSAADLERLAALDEQTAVDRPALLVLGSRADSGHPTAAPQTPGLAPAAEWPSGAGPGGSGGQGGQGGPQYR